MKVKSSGIFEIGSSYIFPTKFDIRLSVNLECPVAGYFEFDVNIFGKNHIEISLKNF